MDSLISLFFVLWVFLLLGLLGIGGFFMFRKFLKQLPKEDGMSEISWQLYYIEKTKHMWGEKEKELLEDFLSPVPELFRDVAKQTIASKVGELALMKNADKITEELLIEGYIIGTPKRDHRFLRKKLAEKNIDVDPYEKFFSMSKDDYTEGWKERAKKERTT